MAGSKTIFYTQILDVKSTDVEGVGRLRWEDDKCYRWVKNNITNVDIAANGIVCHDYTDTTTTLLQRVSKPATANLSLVAGVAVTTIYSNTGTNPLCFGWIQVYGQNDSVAVTPVNTQTTANPVSGNALIAVNAQFYGTSGQAAGTAPIYTRRLILLDSVAGSTTTQVCRALVQCL